MSDSKKYLYGREVTRDLPAKCERFWVSHCYGLPQAPSGCSKVSEMTGKRKTAFTRQNIK
jgi:hypothetical protein